MLPTLQDAAVPRDSFVNQKRSVSSSVTVVDNIQLNNTLMFSAQLATKSVTDEAVSYSLAYSCTTSSQNWAWWLIGRFVAFRAKGRGFESRSSRHVETLGKSFTYSALVRFGVKPRHSIRAVSGAPLSSKEAL